MNLKLILPVLLLSHAITGYSQGSNGLIAHWKFNGNANDNSGNGLHGVAKGVTPATGYHNIANTGYKFKGANIGAGVHEHILIPFDSLMNTQNLSICALVKIDSFYQGQCESSILLERGIQNSQTHYNLFFNDNTYSNNCFVFDPTKVNMLGQVGALAADIPVPNRHYPKYVDTGKWTCVVMTYDSDSLKMYLDGVLYNSLYYNSYNPVLTNDSIRIGAAYYDPGLASGFPYPFYGTMDDMRLYNRALTAAEASLYCDTAKMLPVNAVSQVAEPGLKIFPNPAGDHINIQFSDQLNKGVVVLLNAVGQQVLEQRLDANEMRLNTAALPAGIYLMKVQYKDAVLYRKVVKE